MPSRRAFAAAVASAGLAGLSGCLWRTGLFRDTPTVYVNNYDDDDHEVALSVVAADGAEAYRDTVTMPADTRYERGGPTLTVGRYTVTGTLDGDLVDEYRMAPLDTPVWGTRLPDLIVEVDGELGRFAVLGAGGRP
ncbi:hypothetical protein [Halobaculum litoreum]|uniref:Uncharacterized protein n=1 Tax=Halobaculum litoreum TaxID=3031998 RepID=A0ABD5XWM3_9EURY|nr:hypothetical protein [Halobaculum sp. DT92]